MLASSSINLKEKIVILDRDGVINYDSVHYIRSPEEWMPISGSLEAIARLNHAGFRVAVATNQSGIGRGYYTEAILEAIHQKMHQALQSKGGKIDFIAYCPHLPSDQCACRKPQPGLLLQIAQHFQCNIVGVPFVGDNLSDVNAALAVNAFPLLIGKEWSNLEQIVDAILSVVIT